MEKEQEHFTQIKDYLMQHHEGKFALIYGAELIGIWDSPEHAYLDGIARFGNVPFLIKHIAAKDPVETVPALFVGIK